MYSDVIAVARSCVNKSRYCFLSEDSQPPESVNCYTFVCWAFRQCGVWLPPRLIGQLYCGFPIDASHEPWDGDLVFTTGHRQNFVTDLSRARQGIGHVILRTAIGTGIHSCSEAKTVVEVPLTEILGKLTLRGMYRLPHRSS
jgi:cell wall-associated NlpC family hydrolase